MYISTLISYIIAIINTGIDSHIVHLVDIQLIVEMLFYGFSLGKNEKKHYICTQLEFIT